MATSYPTPTPTAGTPATAPSPRLRSSEVELHLNMVVIGDVCAGIGMAAYRSVLDGFLNDEAGNRAGLLAALDAADTRTLPQRAHAMKGAAASLGLRALHGAADRLEAGGADLSAAACSEAAAELRALLDTAQSLLQRMGLV